MKNYILLALYVVFSSFGMILIKEGGRNSNFYLNKDVIGFSTTNLFIVGILFYLVSFVLWIYILQLFQVTYISPIAYGLTFIMLTLISTVIFNTVVPLKQIIGAIIIIIGILISSL